MSMKSKPQGYSDVFDTITLVLAAMWGVPWCLYICIGSKIGLLAQRDTRDTYYNAIVSPAHNSHAQTIHNLCQTFLIFCVHIKNEYVMFCIWIILVRLLKYFHRLLKLSPGATEFIAHIRLKWDEGP